MVQTMHLLLYNISMEYGKMDEIKKQIARIRDVADNLYKHTPHSIKPTLHLAANTIESLYEKLQAENVEHSDDLISRKALINTLFVRNGRMCPDNDIDNFPVVINVKDVKEAIKNAPAAFDVDNIIDLLLKNQKIMEACLDKEFEREITPSIKRLFSTYTNSQIEIVKSESARISKNRDLSKESTHRMQKLLGRNKDLNSIDFSKKYKCNCTEKS